MRISLRKMLVIVAYIAAYCAGLGTGYREYDASIERMKAKMRDLDRIAEAKGRELRECQDTLKASKSAARH